jgi:hypothetical protein
MKTSALTGYTPYFRALELMEICGTEDLSDYASCPIGDVITRSTAKEKQEIAEKTKSLTALDVLSDELSLYEQFEIVREILKRHEWVDENEEEK